MGAINPLHFHHVDVICGRHLRALEDENTKLQKLLSFEWYCNHDEHCRNEWPHDGECYWPRPEGLGHVP